ncbi:ATP-binding protein [Piscinibacter sp.]|uniref:ATP-binding protein n=1 Tax=Piscinibacter sp. TaxID=1903157 RepID=UPI002BFEEEE0|nr:ATP-binding protein [Albitalea sp.]HUG24322.1 ATP-binding protein [Albitalea sp.]
MDYYGLPEHVASEEARLVRAHGDEERLGAAVTLAWYLRERDPPRSRMLAAQARALLNGAGWLDERRRVQLQGRLELTECLHVPYDAAGTETRHRHLREASRCFEAADDLTGIVDCRLIGFRYQSFDMRVPMLESAIEPCERAGDAVRRALIDCEMAQRIMLKGPASAAPEWAAALDAAASLGHPGLDGEIAFCRGLIHWAGNNAGGMMAEFSRAHTLLRDAGRIVEAATAAANAAGAAIDVGDFAEALELSERALQLARRLGRPMSIALSLVKTGEALRKLGRLDAAAEMLREAHALCEPLPGSQTSALACYHYGDLLLDMQRDEQALALFERGAQQVTSIEHTMLRHCMLYGRASALSRLGRLDEALAAIREVLADSPRTDVHMKALRVMSDIARRHALPLPEGSSAPTAVIHYLEAAVAASSLESDFAETPDLLAELSREYEACGDPVTALAFERRAEAAREHLYSTKVTALATALHVRHETERAHAEAVHQRALAKAQAERADAQEAANRTKSAFLANMSHELRTPLNAMLGFSRLLASDAALQPPRARDDLDVIVRSGEHLYALINQVLEVSKIESGRMPLVEVAFEPAAMLGELQELFAAHARSKGLWLQVRADAGVPQQLRGDAMKLRQVLINLLGNALKFTEQGRVTLELTARAGRSPQGRHLLEFRVADSGKGIAAEELAQLSEAFVQAEAGRRPAQGSGLGLAICRGYARLMGGELELQSRVGRGTTATLRVPLQECEVAPGEAPAPRRRRPRGFEAGQPAARILAVDDSEDGRRLLLRLLQPLGFEVREAGDGLQAVEQWRRWRPHLVCMDIRMPVMDGLQAAQHIKSEAARGEAPVIVALTANSFDEDREQILAAGCDDFLRKPFKEEELFEILERHLGVRFARDGDAQRQAHADAPVDEARIRGLPAGVRDPLVAALEQLDVDAVERAIEAVLQHDAAVAAALATLAQRFDYERLENLLRGA